MRQNSASKRGGYAHPGVVSKNMSNAEYLAMLEQQNQIKRQQEISSKEYQDKIKQQEREKGFNLYTSGANAELPSANPASLGVGKRGANQQLRGARRQWRDPSKSQERNSLSRSPTNQLFNSAYQNPFDLNSKSQLYNLGGPQNVIKPKDQSPVDLQPRVAAHAVRKKWGASQNQRPQIEMGDEQDDDDYSDDDFIEPADKGDDRFKLNQLQSIEENTQESFFDQDYSAIQEDSQANIEVFLKTATVEEMDIIKQSLSNFAEVSKNFTNFAVDRNKEHEDDPIEEDLEEEIPDDNHSSGEEHKFESVKKDQQSRQSKKGRPVSAVYDLSKFKPSAQNQGQQSQRTLPQGGSMMSASNYQSARQIPSTVKRDNSFKATLEQSSNDYMPKQMPSTNKAAFAARPFQRPVSEMKPMRAAETERHLTNLQVPQEYMASTKQAQTGRSNNYASQVNIPIRDVDNLETSYGGASTISQRDTELAQIMQAISGLDDDARKNLLSMLRDKKLQSTFTGPKSVADFSTQNYNNIDFQAPNNYSSMRQFGLPKESTSTRQQTLGNMLNQKSAFTQERTRNELVIRVLSTHGDPHLCGLTEVELFDLTAKKVVLVPANVIIRNQGRHGSIGLPGMHMSTAALVNGHKFTCEHKNMWIGSLPAPQSPPVHLEIVLYYGKDVELSGIKIWNYNKSVRDSTKGVRDIQLFVNDDLKFEGQVQMGKGHVHEDYSSLIMFKPEVKIETEQPKTLVQPQTQSVSQLQSRKSSLNQRDKSPLKQQDNKPLWLPESQSTRLLPKVEPVQERYMNKRQIMQQQKNEKDWQDPYSDFKEEVKPKEIQTNRPNLIEESLDSFDLFKVTNLGRINIDQTQGQKPEAKRKGWGADKKQEESKMTTILSEFTSSSQGGKESASRSGYKAPKLMKSPFPEEFAHPSPAPSRGKPYKEQAAKSSTKQIDSAIKLEQQLKDMKQEGLPQDLEDSFEIELNQLVPNPVVAKQQPPPAKQGNANPFKNKLKIFDQPFIMPTLPQGQKLEFTILDTWGDANYLGLTGIEIFDSFGNSVELNGQKDITASPCDINLLMGYGTDPRTVDKLVDGTYFTNDDFHTWLTPFTQGEDHYITITLPAKLKISMIRIWNYNKSRIHSFRGARLVTCHLDEQLIFRGEIAKAPGNTKDPSQCCEILLFTNDEDLLVSIDSNDWLNNIQLTEDIETQPDTQNDSPEPQRPMTATKRFTEEEVKAIQKNLAAKPKSLFDERPQTRAIRRNKSPIKVQDDWDQQDEAPFEKIEEVKTAKPEPTTKLKGVKGRELQINITESWGDLFYVGLNGIEFYDINGERIKIDISNIDATPRDMNSIPGHQHDHRTLDKLINDINNTSDDKNMWLIPFNSGEDHFVKVDFGKRVNLGSIRFYNYNKSAEDSLRGCKTVVIKFDDQLLTSDKGLTLRKAPGLILPKDDKMRTDFGQSVVLPYCEGWKSSEVTPLQKNTILQVTQECLPPCLPIGFTFKLNLFSTHGDPYYIGLNGIELFDQLGMLIKVNSKLHVTANPPGINRLPGMESDLRTIDNLFNSLNNTFDEKNMWLAPFKFTRSYAAANSSSQTSDQREPNFVSIMFDAPRAISAIRIWNYSKTPSRGVHEFEIVIDDKPVYRGFARQVPDDDAEHAKPEEMSTSVVFTSDPQIVNRFAQSIYFIDKQQEVVLVNEKKYINQGKARNEKFVFNEKERPQTKYGGGFF